MFITRAGGIISDVIPNGTPFLKTKTNGHTNGSSNGSNGTLVKEIEEEFVCEISPLLSYDGEGLCGLVDGKCFKSPVILLSEEEKSRVTFTNGKTTNGCKTEGIRNGCSKPLMNGVH